MRLQCARFGASGAHFRFSLGVLQQKRCEKQAFLHIFWSARPWHADNFVADSAPGSSSMCQKQHFSSISSDSWPFRHFLNLAWPKDGHLGTSAKLFFDFSRAMHGSKIFFSMLPKLIWTFLMADPEAQFWHSLGLA